MADITSEESTGAMLGTSVTVGFLNAAYYVTMAFVFGVVVYLFVMLWDAATKSNHAPRFKGWVDRQVAKTRKNDVQAEAGTGTKPRKTKKRSKSKSASTTPTATTSAPAKPAGVPAVAPVASTGPKPAAA